MDIEMPTTAPVRQRITDLANGAMLMDEREEQGRYEILPWVASGAPLFRTAEPDVPAEHLTVYFVSRDESTRSVLPEARRRLSVLLVRVSVGRDRLDWPGSPPPS